VLSNWISRSRTPEGEQSNEWSVTGYVGEVAFIKIAAALRVLVGKGRSSPTRRVPRGASQPGDVVTPDIQTPTNEAYWVPLALSRLWIERSVEQYAFISSETVRRSISLDFRLPFDPNIPVDRMVAIPLLIPAKESLRNFDIRDEAGKTLSVLSARENGELASQGLQTYLTGVLPQGEALGKDARDAIDSIVKGKLREAPALAEAALAKGGYCIGLTSRILLVQLSLGSSRPASCS
jgi:hypothetical protein